MSIRTRLIRRVTLSVIAAMFIFLLATMVYYYRVLTRQIISDEMWRLKLMSERVRSFQEELLDTASMLNYEIANNAKITALSRDSTPAEALNAHRDIYALFTKSTSSIDNIRSIYLILDDYFIFSSENRAYFWRDMYGEMGWYDAFKATGKGVGYTVVHPGTNPQDRYKEVISFVVSSYDLSGHYNRADLVINIDVSVFKDFFQAKPEDSVALCYDLGEVFNVGNLAKGRTNVSENSADAYYTRNAGGYLLVDKSMNYGFAFVEQYSLDRVYQGIRVSIIIFVLIAALCIIILFFGISNLLNQVLSPIAVLSAAAKRVEEGNYSQGLHLRTGDEFEQLGKAFDDMMVGVGNSLERQERINQMELDRLLLQINPHFVTNTLSSILFMAQAAGNKDIVVYTKAFSNLIDSILRLSAGGTFVTLGEEIENVKNYLILQQYRYPDRFNTQIEIDDTLLPVKVPNMLLQPLVENSIFYGILPKEEIGNITVSAACGDDTIILEVIDDGIGMTDNSKEKLFKLNEENVSLHGRTHIGFQNVLERIRLIYGERGNITVESRPMEGTRITIRIPNG